MTWLIRPAMLSDTACVARVFRASALSNDGNRENLLAHPEALEFSDLPIVEGRTRVAADADGDIVGFATYVISEDIFNLDDLFVNPGRMGNGVGSALVEDVIALAQEHGTTRIEVTADKHALGFYEKAGFVYDHNVYTRFGPAPRMHLDVGPNRPT